MKVKRFQGKEVWGRGDRRGTSPDPPLPKEKSLERRRHGWNLSDKLAQSEIPYKLTAFSLEILYERKKRFSKYKKQKQRNTTTTCYLWRLRNYQWSRRISFHWCRVLLRSAPLEPGPDGSLLRVLLHTLWDAISLVSSHRMPAAIIKAHQDKAILNVHQQRNVVHIYSEILLSQKKEWNNAICSNMDRPRDFHTEWSQSDRERQISRYHLYMKSKKRV